MNFKLLSTIIKANIYLNEMGCSTIKRLLIICKNKKPEIF